MSGASAPRSCSISWSAACPKRSAGPTSAMSRSSRSSMACAARCCAMIAAGARGRQGDREKRRRRRDGNLERRVTRLPLPRPAPHLRTLRLSRLVEAAARAAGSRQRHRVCRDCGGESSCCSMTMPMRSSASWPTWPTPMASTMLPRRSTRAARRCWPACGPADRPHDSATEHSQLTALDPQISELRASELKTFRLGLPGAAAGRFGRCAARRNARLPRAAGRYGPMTTWPRTSRLRWTKAMSGWRARSRRGARGWTSYAHS